MLKDKLALEIVEKVVQNLAIIVQNITLIINPQVIIIGGDILGLPDLKTLFIEPMKKMIEKNVPFKIPDIKLSSLGIDGGVIGGLVLAIENTLNKDFPYIMSRSV